jgi:glycosyltransferase involved in cell wall biosynthesis
MPSTTLISVVICTRNRPDLIGNAVASVLANDHPSFDVLVVDQSTDARTGEIVRGLGADAPNLRYLHTSKAGLSRAYNIGIRETGGQILAFTDDDCIAPTNWITTVAKAFAAEPEGELLYGQVRVPSVLADRADDVPTLDIQNPWKLNRRRPFLLYGMGANFAARRSLFNRIGLFDEVLGGGGPLKSSQDFDLQYRAYVGGATVLFRPEVTIDHYGIRSPEQWTGTNRAYGTGDGAFWAKHIRCGDTYALAQLSKHLGRTAIREVLHRVGLRRRANSRVDYLRGVFAGVKGSFSFPVDRHARMYLNREVATR